MNDKDVITQEDYGQQLNAEANMILRITKDNAKADGTDTDIAHVTFENVDDSITNVRIDYTILSGNAVFLENNSKKITKHTNSALSSTVSFIDNTAGSGTIKATPYFNPSAAPAPVTYNFVAPQRSLSLSVNKDNQQADGKSFDEVVASLKDNKGMPVAGEKLIFSIPSNGTSQFKDGGTTLTLTTNETGQCNVRVIDTGKKDIAVTVTCTSSSDPSLNKSIDIHFKQSVSVADFKLEALVSRGVAGDIKPATVRATIIPHENSAPADYIIHFSLYGPAIIPYYLGTITPAGMTSGKDANPELDLRVKVSGITSIDAWIHDLDTHYGATNVQAELKTISGEHIAYSREPNPAVSFSEAGTQPTPAPTSAPLDNQNITIEYVSHTDNGLTGTVTFRTKYESSGKTAPNAEFWAGGYTFPSGRNDFSGPFFDWPDAPNHGTTFPSMYQNHIRGRSDGNGLSTLRWKITERVTKIYVSMEQPSNKPIIPAVTGKITLNL